MLRLRLLPMILVVAAGAETPAPASDAASSAPPAATADADVHTFVATPPPRHPKPTAYVGDPDSASRNKQRRKAWMKELHKAPPDVDVAEVERDNGDAQRVKRNTLSSFAAADASRWTEIGSRNLAGRMHAAAHSPDGQTLYAGSSRGGVWRGTLDGDDWTPIGDGIYGGAHWLAVVSGETPSDPDVVLRATDGGLVHVTRDEGVTWETPAGLGGSSSVRRVLVTTDGTETIYLVAYRAFGVPFTPKWALYRSTDRAQSFDRVYELGNWAGDAWAPRDGGSTIYLLEGGRLRASTDGGASFPLVGNVGVTGSGGELTASEAGAPRFYAILNVGGTRRIYRSDDGGVNWTQKADVTDYWGSLSASIVDPDLFVYGGVEVWRSTDGADTFAKVNNWWEYYGEEATKLHADIPGLDVVALGPGLERWYVATDGGLYRSDDGLASVENLSLEGLGVSQYYSTHTSTANVLNVVAGSQDQGYQRADDPPPPGETARTFAQLISGDYGHLTSSDGTHAYLYSTYPGFILIHKGETAPQLLTADFPTGIDHAWLPPVVADPNDPLAFVFVGSTLYRYASTDGSSWTAQPWSAQSFGGSAGEYASALCFSPLDASRVYAATNWGRLFRSTDGGASWDESASTGPGAQYFYGTAMVASAVDVDTVYVGGSGYGFPAVWRSTDGGLTYSPYADGLPDTLVYDLAESPDGVGTLFAASETAAWRRDPGAPAAWVDITEDDAPITTYWSVEGVAAENVMRFGTYGRGIWDYELDENCLYEIYGLGGGVGNFLSLDTTSPTFLGTTHVLDVGNGLPGSAASLLYSPNEAYLPLQNAVLLVDPGLLLTIPFGFDFTGSATLSLPIPADPVLAGLPLHFQVAMKNPPLVGGWSFSNGLQGVLCEE